MKKYFLLILLGLIASGCQPVIRLIYGIKQPDYYSTEKIKEFQNEIGLGEFDYIGFSAENWIALKGRGIPDLFVFDNRGRFIDFHDSLKPNCNGPAEQFLSELNPDRVYNYSEKYNLKNFVLYLENSNCGNANISLSDSTDFYVFLSYASFMGKKIHRHNTTAWKNAVMGNKNIHYKLFYISEDLKSCWSDEEKKLFEEKKN